MTPLKQIPADSDRIMSQSLEKSIDNLYDRAYDQGWNHALEIVCMMAEQYPLLVERIKARRR